MGWHAPHEFGAFLYLREPCVPLTTPTLANLAIIPSGAAGTVATLKLMRASVARSLRSPDQAVRLKALEIVRGIAARQYTAEASALHRFVRDAIRYVKDVDGIETLQTAEKTLELAQGDCDDKSTLLATLLKSVGHPVKFVALGFNGKSFSHVLIETRVKDKWIPAETIIPKPFGWYPRGVTSRYELNV